MHAACKWTTARLRSALDSEARARVQDASDSSSILADLKRSMDRMQVQTGAE